MTQGAKLKFQPGCTHPEAGLKIHPEAGLNQSRLSTCSLNQIPSNEVIRRTHRIRFENQRKTAHPDAGLKRIRTRNSDILHNLSKISQTFNLTLSN